jgi:CO/xanthine dehydrogenase FAD-binding subunit
MRTAIGSLELVEPRSVGHAVQMLRDARPKGGLVPLAGCTDLYVSLNFGTLDGQRFLDLWPLRELRTIEAKRGVLSIGALATYSELIASPLVRRHLPMLAAAAREIGGVQIQNRGTLGGNIANASPAGDSLPVLAVADAVVVLRSADGIRRVPFADFYTGYRQTVRQPDELIVAVEIPPVRGRQWFRKVGTRAAQAISKVVIAGVRAPHPRLALGSVAPVVMRARRTEEALAAGASLDEAGRVLAAEISPIDDLRSTADYRRQVTVNLLRRFWQETGK